MRSTVLAAFVVAALLCAGPALAAPITVTYTASGGPGNYVLDFSLTNNIVDGHVVYMWGVDVPDDPAQVNPGGWIDPGYAVNTGWWGGSGRIYPSDVWAVNGWASGVAFGQTLSGFRVNTASIPDIIHYFAISYGGGIRYTGEFQFLSADNPGFEGIDDPGPGGNVVPEPASMLLFGTGCLAAFLLKRRR